MLFRHLLTTSCKTGTRGRYISKRTLKTIDTTLAPILLVDCSYIAYLLESRNNSKRSNIYSMIDEKLVSLLINPPKLLSITDKNSIYRVRDIVLTLFKHTINMIKPDNIILVYGSGESLLKNRYSEQVVRAILEPLNLDYITLTNAKFSDFTFSFLQKYSDELSNRLMVYVTNSMTTWACCSHTLQHGCICYTKNLRPIFYSNKTGLDIVSKFIGTSKIVNKLGLDDLKYVNLQYLYILMLYVKFLHHKEKTSTYFFDAKYFKQEKDVEYDKFLRSKGKGLEMIGEAHKTLSYIFLTKPDLMDQFLFYPTHMFILNLKRLVKITEFDKNLMSHLSNYYSTTDRLREVTINFSNRFSFAPLIRDRMKSGTSKVEIFPSQYDQLLSALQSRTYTRKKVFQVEKSVLPAVVSTDNSISESVAKILRNLLW